MLNKYDKEIIQTGKGKIRVAWIGVMIYEPHRYECKVHMTAINEKKKHEENVSA